MKIRHDLVALTIGAVFLFAGAVHAAEKIHGDRSRLTFRDAGVYCSLSLIHGRDPANEGLTNMLSPERAVQPETPWTFYIMQGNDSLPDDAHVSLLRAMARNGKKVILRAKVGWRHKTPDVDKMEQWLVTFFERVDPDWLYAVTLDEERVYWNGWSDALSRLYHRVKARWPDLPVYQWWTPMEVPDVRAVGDGWVALPADGWVIDLYGEPRRKFEKKLLKALETGKPVVHIAWASPTWLRWSGADTWEGGRRVMDDQIDVCRAYNVPVAYFCTQNKEVDKEGNKIFGIRWGWHAKDPVVRRFYGELEALVMNFRHVPEASIGYRTLDAKTFDWARASEAPVGVSYGLDEKGRKQATIECDLAPVPAEPGTYQLPMSDSSPWLAVECILDDSARRLDGRLRVRGVKDKQFRVPIVFRIESERSVSLQGITARLSVTKELGGSAILSWSADGTNWKQPVSVDRAQSLTVNLPGEKFGTDPVWVRVELISNSGLPTSTCSNLVSLRVIAALDDGIAPAP